MRTIHAWLLIGLVGAAAMAAENPTRRFDSKRDLISVHYDHAPDKDDGQSAAADRTILQTLFGADWLKGHVVAVSGAYGKNRDRFNRKSDAVMDACWAEPVGWIAVDGHWETAVVAVARRWRAALESGGDVWVKEGGQSDLTADVMRRLREQRTDFNPRRIHLVQHSNWNEKQTTDADLAYVKQHADYIRIKDANAYLNRPGRQPRMQAQNIAFQQVAEAHPTFGEAWAAAFEYYDPRHRLDFSDTGELMHILGLGRMGLDAFQQRFLRDAGDEQ